MINGGNGLYARIQKFSLRAITRRILIAWNGEGGGVEGLFVVTFLCKFNEFVPPPSGPHPGPLRGIDSVYTRVGAW